MHVRALDDFIDTRTGRFVPFGRVLPADHPIVTANPTRFSAPRPDVEQATAAPGELR